MRVKVGVIEATGGRLWSGHELLLGDTVRSGNREGYSGLKFSGGAEKAKTVLDMPAENAKRMQTLAGNRVVVDFPVQPMPIR